MASTSPIPIFSSLSKISSKSLHHPPKPSNLLKFSLDSHDTLAGRREFLTGISLVSALPASPLVAGAREVEVGSYLPTSLSDPSFVVFKATPKDTPALRAGNVQPYQFMLPPTWKQTRVANILSGNYCQPKCAEPWVEVKFEDENQGKVQVVASPLVRLTNKPNASIEDIGSPEKVIASLGPFVTGNTYDSDELLEASVEKLGNQTVRFILLSSISFLRCIMYAFQGVANRIEEKNCSLPYQSNNLINSLKIDHQGRPFNGSVHIISPSSKYSPWGHFHL